MLKSKYILKSRYGDKYELKKSNDNAYLFKIPNSYHIRCGINESKQIYFIDPPGGPFLQVGEYYSELKATIIGIESSNEGFIVFLDDKKYDISSKQTTDSI